MKKYLFSIIFLLVSFVGFSQKGLSYQAVVLDPTAIEIPGQDISSQPLVNGDVWMKFSIYNGSTLQFEEVQKTKTDAYGLVNLMIGSVSTASFNSLTWDGVQKSMQVFVSFNQGASYTKVSDQKLNYNPYALYAETAGKLGSVLSIAGGGTGATTAADARVNLGLGNVDNTSDAAKPISTATQNALNLKANAADVTAGLALKANASDMTAALAAKADTGTIKTFVVTQVAAATIADADATTKGKIQLAGDLAGTADAPTVPGLALKANTADVTAALTLKANASNVTNSLNLKENISNKSTNLINDGTSDTKYPSVKAVKTYVDAQLIGGLGAATITDADANTKGKIQLAGDLGGTAAAPTVPGLALKANTADLLSLTSIVNSNTTSITAEVTRATAAELVLTNSVASNTASITANTNDIATLNTSVASNTASITAEVIRATAAELALSNSVSSNTASITANTATISAEVVRATAAELALSNSVSSNTASITAEVNRATAAELALSNSMASNTASITANTATISAEVVRATAAELALSNSVASKANNSDLSSGLALKAPTASPNFTGIPTAPTASTGTSSTQIATTAFVANATSSILANSISGTVAVVNGGTGATSLTGLVKGNGTNALTAAVAGTDYQAPITLTTLGSGSATLSGTTLNIPAVSSTVNAGSISGTVAISNGGTGQTTVLGIRTALGLYSNVVSIGNQNSGQTNQASDAVSIGGAAGNSNQGVQSVAIGYVAGRTSQGLNSIAIGGGAGQVSQGASSIAIGFAAGQNSQGTNSIAIGKYSIASANSVALGNDATTGTYSNSTSLGNGAVVLSDNTVQLGNTSVTNVKTSGTLTAGTVTYPKAHNSTAGQILTIDALGAASWTNPSTGGSTYSIGLNNELGGYVVYVTPDGKHGLVAETIDQVRNTQMTASGFNSGEIFRLSYLATDPLNHSTAGKNFMDWRIPNYWEMLQVMQYKNQIGGFDPVNWPYYFLSISINRDVIDWIVSINGGDWTGQAPNRSLVAVRTVRSF